MIKAINLWSFPEKLSVEQCMTQAKKLGFQGVELTYDIKGRLTPSVTEEDCENIRRIAHKLGLQLICLAGGISWQACPTSDSASERDKSVELHRRMIQVARWLGVDSTLIVPGMVYIPGDPKFKPIRYDTVYERSAEFIEKLLPFAEKYQIRLCIENSPNGFLTSPLELKDFVDSFDHPSVRIYFDIGNSMRYGIPHHWIEILGNKIHRVHVKDFSMKGGLLNGDCPLLGGDVCFKEAVRALKKQGYDRSLTVEFPSSGDAALKHSAKSLDKIIRM